MNYTYTIFDANPNTSSGTAWPSHTEEEIEADSDADAREAVRDVMSVEAAGLSASDGYGVGDVLHALVWDENGIALGSLTYEVTLDDLGISKHDVDDWDTVAQYVATFPADGGEGACDVEVQIGEAHGAWFVRTNDDAGGDDEADDTSYRTRVEAMRAAQALAEKNDEAGGLCAEDYLRAADEAAAGEPDPGGEWCVYWETALDDSGPRDRYATQEQAEAAAKIANADLRAHNPGNLLCGFSVRSLVDGEWVAGDSE